MKIIVGLAAACTALMLAGAIAFAIVAAVYKPVAFVAANEEKGAA